MFAFKNYEKKFCQYVLLTEHNFDAQTATQFIYSASSVAEKKVGSVQGCARF